MYFFTANSAQSPPEVHMNIGKPAWVTVPVHVCALYEFHPVYASSLAIAGLNFAEAQSHDPRGLWMAL